MIAFLVGVIVICIFAIAASILMLVYRILKGPSNPDRAVALDTLGINLLSMVGLLAILLDTSKFNDIILLIGILSFIGSIALAKFLEKGVIIERDHH